MTSQGFCIMAVDPGLTGAAAFYFPSHPELISAEDLPVAGREIDGAALRRRIDQLRPDVVLVEQVASRPGQGVSSTFKFGMAYGVVLGVIEGAGVPLHRVTPGTWKRHFHLPADKEMARALAIRIWPTSAHFGRKKDHGRAEAALLARYAAEMLPGARPALLPVPGSQD